MAKAKPNLSRRREVRRHIPRTAPALYQWLRRRETMWACVYLLAFILLGGLLMVMGNQRMPYTVNQTVTETIFPRVSFDALDKDATKRKEDFYYDTTPMVYDVNQTYLDSVRQQLHYMLQLGNANDGYESFNEIPAETVRQYDLREAGFEELKQFASSDAGIARWRAMADRFVRGIAGIALLSKERAHAERAFGSPGIIIRHPDPARAEERRESPDILGVDDDPERFARNVTRLADIFPPALRKSVIAVVMEIKKPIYQFNEELSKQRREAAIAAVQPIKTPYSVRNALVIAGEKLTADHVARLDAERQAYRQSLGALYPWVIIPSYFGIALLMGVGLWVYILAFLPRIAANPMRGLAITALLVGWQAVAVLATSVAPQFVFATAVMPTLMVAITLAIAYDQRLALAVGAAHGLLVMLSLDLPLQFTMVILVGLGAAVAQLSEVRTRSKLVVLGFWSGLAMALTTVIVLAIDWPVSVEGYGTQVLFKAMLALSTGIVTGMFAQAVLPIVERIFNITTAMTLKELSDASHPVLRRLAQEAPGTFQHSLHMGVIGEAAAEAINADGLLCKVGAMYHDIGKINKPMYFVENQGGGPNRHSKLSPAMSLLIIVGHVKDGMEMAREYNIPRLLRHFIESHHGTTLVEYFYHAAKQQQEDADAPAPSEFEYRYPGPKPQTREAAILMLADGIEGAARSMPEPTPARLEQLVHRMAQKRLMDGQFDECNLTLAELHRIETSMTKTLCAIYHGRIAYPSDKRAEAEEAAAAAARTAKSAS